nr:hypothetical protein [Bacteroidota bacterium]
MKKFATFLFLNFILNLATITIYAQSGVWTWISGDSTSNSLGVFGAQGVPSANNHPPGVYEPCEWKDKQGNFWVYGGNSGYSDLWKFNPGTLEWTWVKGSGFINQPAIYGTKGVATIANTPGTRKYASTSWVDTAGNFWLFGGDAASNALWKYDLATNMWTWVNGTTNINAFGVYGIKGVPAALNVPCIRSETCSGWTDSLNNLWLFGGFGNGASALGNLGDLWKYNITTNEWTWMAGDSVVNNLANYGVKGVSSATNNPGGRYSYTKWKDVGGNFWIFGGGTASNVKNDVWKYQPDINQWVWMNGKNTNDDVGNYNSFCTFDSTLLPRARREQRFSVTDNCGRFWMYAGFNNGAFPQNDLWFFDPQKLQWKLLNGTNQFFQPGDYGLLGVSSVNNLPPSRGGASAWWGDDNKFYMFGGWYSSTKSYADVWVFDPDTNCISFSCNYNIPVVANLSASDTTVCEKLCIGFFDISQNYPTSWQWTFNGASPSTSTLKNPQNIATIQSKL